MGAWRKRWGGGRSHDLANLFCFATVLTFPISLLILYAYGGKRELSSPGLLA